MRSICQMIANIVFKGSNPVDWLKFDRIQMLIVNFYAFHEKLTFKSINFQAKLGWDRLFPSQIKFYKNKIANIKSYKWRAKH